MPTRNQTLRLFETRKGAATRKVKTVSEGGPPAVRSFFRFTYRGRL